MTSISQTLKLLIKNQSVTVTELARQVNIAQPVIHRMVTGETKDPKVGTLQPIADYFNISLDQLIGNQPLPNNIGESDSLRKTISVPVIEWNQVTEQAHERTTNNHYIPTNLNISEKSFALEMEDTTMRPTFPEGSILIFDPTLEAQDKDFVLLQLKNQKKATFKQLLFDGETVYLNSLNTSFQPLVFENISECKFLGVLAGSFLTIKKDL